MRAIQTKRRAGRKPGNGIDARSQLLAAASELMIEKQTIDVSIVEIAHRAQLNSALVSYYFGGKEGLLLALAMRDTGQAVHALEGLMSMPWPPEVKLRKHIAGIINFNFRYPYMTRLIHVLLRDAASKSALEITRGFSEPVTKAQAQLLKEGVETGIFRPVDPVLFYFSVIGACDYLFWGRSALEFVFGIPGVDDSLRRAFIDHTVDLLLRGCLADPTRTDV